MFEMKLPIDMRDEDWLPFWGRAEIQGDKALLIHRRSPDRILVKLVDIFIPDKDQVTFIDSVVLVRRGSTYIDIQYRKDSPPPFEPERSSKGCKNGSQCVSQLEYCCGARTLVGICYGRWGCS